MRIGVECGGTFTDLVVLDDNGRLCATDKVFSTPAAPAEAVLEGLSKLSSDLVSSSHLLHGSTVATNALIERKGATIGLIMTRGFRDTVFLQRQDRDRMYDLKFVKPRPLVDRRFVREVTERVDAQGQVVVHLDKESVLRAAKSLVANGVDSIAVSLLHSYANPDHEQQIKALLGDQYPDLVIALSSECAREFREYERTSTTTIDAFIRPRIFEYLTTLEDQAKTRGILDLQVMQSNGGMVPVRTAAENPLTMLRSGPAAGVAGAIAVAQNAGYGDIVTMDMGGTSTDVAVIRAGVPELTAESTADGLPLRVPMLDIVSVGAGGGSLVDIDSGGLLTVGPRSAGAMPGPVCYMRGGIQPTVTDANVARGLIQPETFLGGKHPLNREAAIAALQPYADKVGRTVEGLAEDIYELASVSMANAIRMTTTERGHEVTDYTLCAYGGAGALHAASVADELGMKSVLIPPHNGLASAYGLLTAGFRREFSRTRIADIASLDQEELAAECESLIAGAAERLHEELIDTSQAIFAFAADMRYRGQGFEVLVDFPDGSEWTIEDLMKNFHVVHKRRYGHSDSSRSVQLVTIRLTVTKPRPHFALPKLDIDPQLPRIVRQVVEDGNYVDAVFRRRRSISVGETQVGPAVLEDDTSTTFVPSGWAARVDEHTNLILERS